MKGSVCKQRAASLCGDVNAGRDEMECARTQTGVCTIRRQTEPKR